MNGYKALADGYRQMAEKGEIPHEKAERLAALYDFLSGCDNGDFYDLFDSSAFNEIAKAYLRLAVKNLVRREILDDEQSAAVLREYVCLLSEVTAREAEG